MAEYGADSGGRVKVRLHVHSIQSISNSKLQNIFSIKIFVDHLASSRENKRKCEVSLVTSKIIVDTMIKFVGLRCGFHIKKNSSVMCQ